MTNDMATSSELLPSSNPETPTLDSSSSALRFPTPVADERISHWIQSTSSTTMSVRSEAPSDEGNLGDSTYEFIDTDEESRDGNATESVASTDFGRPDDVASLADTERSGEESEDEGSSSIPTFPGLDNSVGSAFDTPKVGGSSAILVEDTDRPLTQSIEFEEPFSLGAENVSVKHTVADLNEEQTAVTARNIMIQSPPTRMQITIRQTMTKQGLSTRDPLRILYIGSHSAKQDIIHKIASSVTASVDTGKRGQGSRQPPSQLYNVVPVSAFGSERTPEIELMHSSGYQINVEDCVSAQNLKFEDIPQKPDVVKLTLEDNFSYHSVPEGQGFIIEPFWELPHVAIFYCSDSDGIEARRTRTIARKFMSRHSVPSIVISHKELSDRGQSMSLDQHSIHMCLESRDPNGRGSIIHQRLPIDLASFLNIDARQMNRNLAYLTGLHDPLEIPTPPIDAKKTETPVGSHDVEKTSCTISDKVNFIRNRTAAEWRALLPVGFLLLSVVAAVFTSLPTYRSTSLSAISINSKVMSAVPISTATLTSSSSIASITSMTSSLDVKTSTQTVTVTYAPGPNSLSVLPSMELGKSAQPPQPLPKPGNRTSICTAETLGDREILIRIPSATKLSWLTKEAMSVNITRGNTTVDTERAYSSDEGIVLQLAKEDAYGILNISIVTTRKPRVNETFQVDFGTSPIQSVQQILDNVWTFFKDDTVIIDAHTLSEIRSAAKNMVKDVRENSQSALSRIEGARKLAVERATASTVRLTAAAKSLSLEAAKRSAILSKELGFQLAEAEATLSRQLQSLQQLRKPLDNGLLRAQINSKLLWLKLQGKEAEYEEYKRRATEATQNKEKGSYQFRKGTIEDKKPARAAKRVTKQSRKVKQKWGKKAGN